jgi:hypothetical protein
MITQDSTSSRPKRVAGLVFILLFGTIWAGGTFVADWFVFRGAVRQVDAEFYATTTGRVTYSGLNEHRGSRGRTDYAPDIKFTYEVAGQAYSGDRYRYGQPYLKRAYAAGVIAEYPEGKEVTVYYNPSDSTDSLLQPGLMGIDLSVALFLMPFNVIAIGLWWAVLNQISARIWPRPAGGAKVTDDGFEVRVRLGGSPMVAVLVTVGVLSLLAIFPVAFATSGTNPPMLLMLVTWGVLVAAGLLVFFIRWSKLISGVQDLVIDDTARTVTLPQTMGRKDNLTIPIASVAGIDLETITKRTSKADTSTSYALTIQFIADNDQKRRERIVAWHDESQARALARWIELRLKGRQATKSS